MKKVKIKYNKICFLVICSLALMSLFLLNCAKTVVQENGQLQVIGRELCNERKEPLQLKGMCLMDVSWFGDFANAECFKWLHDNWG